MFRLVLERQLLEVIAEADAQGPRGLHGGTNSIDRAEMDGVDDRHASHQRRLVANHVAEFPLDNQPHRVGSELSGDNAVESRGGSTALQVAEDDGTGFLASPPL